jgi:hypothetical protein
MKHLALVASLAVVGCGGAHNADTPDLATVGPPAQHDKVDVLFMVDNSNSTSVIQTELRAAFPTFLKAIDEAAATHPASYHFGVVSSDVGAALNTTDCKPGGDGGRLHVAPDPKATGAPAACASFTLGGGVSYIDYDQINGTSNIVGGIDVPTAFNCISSVGGAGCGFEAPLESTYLALHADIPENAGFLRDDALLVVLYVTDEDDCSAPATTDLFNDGDAALAQYGPLESFRCTQFGIACGDPATPVQPVDSHGPLADCRPLTMAEGGKLIDVQKYIDFFTTGGGVKADPRDVILAAIAAPPAPVATRLTTASCGANVTQCAYLDQSCVSATDPQLFGDPAVRLSAVVNAAPNSQLTSMCDGDDRPPLQTLAQMIAARLR